MALLKSFSTTVHGSMVFTGNTLGLGVGGNINAFITLDTTQTVPGYPAGSTLVWQDNSSSAQLSIPVTGRVLYAELSWGGTAITFGASDVSAFIDDPIYFETPTGSYMIAPNVDTNSRYTFNGNVFYSRSADVTSILQSSGSGTYTVGSVPATIIFNSISANSAGWTLGVIYEDDTLPVRNMSIYSGLQGVSIQGATPITDIEINDFLAPSSGAVSGRILLSAMEGDPGIVGDQALFGPNNLLLTNLSGPNNLASNFFASQINNANSESPTVGFIDTSGTFGTLNPTPGVNPPTPTRYGWDITNVNAPNLSNNQTSAILRITTTGDAYAVPLVGIQIASVVLDYGDAPDTSSSNGPNDYSTLLANNGPRHELVNNLTLGLNVTFEDNAYENPTATGDDIVKGIQDDGPVILPLTPMPYGSSSYGFNMTVVNNTGKNSHLYVWLDYNQNGIFETNEGFLATIPTSTLPQIVPVILNKPLTTTYPSGYTFIRARLTTDTLVNTGTLTTEDTRSLGLALDGEVEDYMLEIYPMDFGDAPDTSSGNGPNNYSTLLINNGPMHKVTNYLTLGSAITSEANAYENPTATGDDLSQSIQDDGPVYTLSPIVSGDSTYILPVNYSNYSGSNAYVYGWVDFNRDGIFQINEASNFTVVPSSTSNPNMVNLVFNVPPGVIPPAGNTTFIRVRLTTDLLTQAGTLPSSEDSRSLGFASDGEVEDYMVNIIELNIKGTVWYDVNCDGLMTLGELMAKNVTVELFSSSNPTTAIRSTTTDASGNYSFNNLPTGDYFVKVTLPSGYSYTVPYVGANPLINSNVDNQGGTSSLLSLGSSNQLEIVNAGLCKPNKISGNAFFDCNNDGILNSTEPYLCGVTMILLDTIANVVSSTVTDCSGYYEFTNVAPGGYSIKPIPLPEMILTTTNSGNYYGSKAIQSTGIFTLTLTNSDYTEGFVGFTGSVGQILKYCNDCNSCNDCNMYMS